MNYKVLFAATLAAAAVHANTINDELPKSWYKAGKNPAMNTCQAGTDEQFGFLGENNITLKCDASTEGFITAMQQFSASSYRGSRVRFSAQVKTNEVKGWSGLWMRIDTTEQRSAVFDNMADRPITGTQDWTLHEVVLDVPQAGEKISFGVLMADEGQVWLKNVDFEVVPTNIAVTAQAKRPYPNNLELQQ